MNATNKPSSIKVNSLKAAQESAPSGTKFVLVRTVRNGSGITWFFGFYQPA